jgi:hypothetical protein
VGDTKTRVRWFVGSLQSMSTAPSCTERVTTFDASSLEVTVSCRVLALRPVLSHWFDNPSSSLRWRSRSSVAPDHEVFPEAALHPRCESRALSSHRVAPSTEFDRAVPPSSSRSRDRTDHGTSLGILFPFDAWRIGGATNPELTSLRSLHSQGFSPSQRLAPRRNLPALFHAGNVHGVLPSELSPLEEPYRLSTASALLVFPLSPSVPHDPTLPRETGRSPLPASGRTPVASYRYPHVVSPPLGVPPPCARRPAEASFRAPRSRHGRTPILTRRLRPPK